MKNKKLILMIIVLLFVAPHATFCFPGVSAAQTSAMKVKIGQVCGGDGACGTCRIEITSGWDNLTPQTPDETYKELEPPFRLSCQARLLGDVTFKIAKIE